MFKLLIGENTTIEQFVVSLVFALIGVIISLLIHASNRDKDSVRTPYKWSWLFLFSDNAKRLLLNLILIIIALRFYPELFGKEITQWSSLLLGVSFDKIAELLRNKNILD